MGKRLMRRLGWLPVVVVLALAGCRGGSEPAPAVTDAAVASGSGGGAPSVVATIFPLADITRQLVDPGMTVVTLVPAGSSPHTYEPSPEKVRQIADAAVIVRVGGGADQWLDGLLGSGSGKLVTALEVTALLPATGGHDHGEQAGETDLAAMDPHVWLDPIRVKDDLAPAIAAALAGVVADEEALAARLADYQARLQALDDAIRATLADLSSRRYIATHAAWQYFNQRYGLDLATTVEPQAGVEPSARWLAEVVEVARRERVRAIFAEAQASDRLVKVVGAETGLRVGVLDPLGGEGIPDRDGYEALMRYNAAQIAEALRP